MSNEISLIPKSPAEVAKAILYIALTALGFYSTLSVDGLSTRDILTIAVAGLGLIPVYLLAGTVVKTTVAFGLAALQAVIVVLGPTLGLGALTLNDWIG